MGYVDDFIYGASPERKKRTSLKKTKRKSGRDRKTGKINPKIKKESSGSINRPLGSKTTRVGKKGKKHKVKVAGGFIQKPKEVVYSSQIKKKNKKGKLVGTGKYKYHRKPALNESWGKLWFSGLRLPPGGDYDEDGTPNIVDEARINPDRKDWLEPQIGKGNEKLNKKTMLVWSLPPYDNTLGIIKGKVCVGASKGCKEYCYAKKRHKQYPGTFETRTRNLYYSKHSSDHPDGKGFVKRISDNIKNSGRKIVRVHESGDFYSAKYLSDWKKIAENNKDVKFHAFTKTAHLEGFKEEFNVMPSNFHVKQSRDKSTLYPPHPNLSIAYVGDRGDKVDRENLRKIQNKKDCPCGFDKKAGCDKPYTSKKGVKHDTCTTCIKGRKSTFLQIHD